jgi:hypothetical protein
VYALKCKTPLKEGGVFNMSEIHVENYRFPVLLVLVTRYQQPETPPLNTG